MLVHEGVGFGDLDSKMTYGPQPPAPGCIKLQVPPSTGRMGPPPPEDVTFMQEARARYKQHGSHAQYLRETEAVRDRMTKRNSAYLEASRRDRQEKERQLAEAVAKLEADGWTVKETEVSRPGRGSRYTVKTRWICPPPEEDDEE